MVGHIAHLTHVEDLLAVLWQNKRLEPHIQPCHDDGYAAFKDDCRRLWVCPDIELRHDALISPGYGAAHHDNLTDFLPDLGIELEEQCDVGQRRDGDEGDGLLAFHDNPTHCVDRVLLQQGRRVRGGKVVTLHAGLAVDIGGVHKGLQQRLGAALCHRDFLAEESQQLQRVFRHRLQGHVARHGSQQLDLKPVRKQGDGQGKGIVNAGVCVDNDGSLFHVGFHAVFLPIIFHYEPAVGIVFQITAVCRNRPDIWHSKHK